MVLSKHINSLELESTILKNLPKARLDNLEYIDQYDSQRLIPRFEIPFKSSDGSLIHKYLNQELTLDGNPTLNLASFVNTWVDPTQIEIAVENLTKNLADNDEYPSLIDIQARCITMLSNLWHAPSRKDEAGNKIVDSIGTATTGSSEAIMLAGLALKKRWQEKRLAEGKDISKPNILMATCAQVALEKFAVYFDVENRLIPISPESGHVIDTSKIRENIDENTIGIFVILGSTFTGAFEPVEEIAQLLDEHEKETGLDIRIHVDGASGGFVAPFAFPNLKWDFSIDRVDSINTSGHKFGMTSVGLGWVIWKHADLLPKQLKFNLDYLGGVEETFGLNFSRPGFPVIMQYYNFLTLGKEGYAAVFDGCMSNARLLSDYLSESKYFEVVSNIHKRLDEAGQKKAYTKESHHQLSDIWTINQQFEPGLPVVAFRFSKEFRDKYPEVPQELFSTLLRKHGYIVPNYHLPPTENDVEILRVVVRNSMSLSLMSKLVSDCTKSAELLVKAAEFVRNYDHTKADKTSEQRTESIHELLLTIASGGTAQVKKEQHEKTGHESGKHKTSYRGTC
ncbi:glutamate decarboxylase gad1 [Lodderomyces elongisporus]|uniref:glutamate decarboxylase gad1 n=1 Tax=Lodderomyces elongisporus TaxID=36914 RepID=UPI0029262A2B|nr:glutamate decarboxylase gad1 [Lodderomyces elongisporus]WLF76646.1 glutamate decarboxylase gad1 [Lodderomyces elongisporus]